MVSGVNDTGKHERCFPPGVAQVGAWWLMPVIPALEKLEA